MKIKALILAGGQARRFGGGDKGLALLDGRTLIDHVLDALAGCEVALSANGDPGRFDAFGLPVLEDGEFTGMGPLAGLAAGLQWARDADVLISVPCDTPILPPDLIPRLLPGPAYARSDGRDHYLVASWRPDCLPHLLAVLRAGDSLKVEGLTRAVAATPIEFTGGNRLFANINRREDLDSGG